MLQDLRIGLRTLRQSKTVTLVAVLSLGLGIGASATIYALLDQLLIHNLTAPEPERLVGMYGSWSSYPNYRDIRASGVFAELTADAMCYPEPRWRVGDQTYAVSAQCVSGNYFEVMGVKAALGRLFTEEEAAPEQNPRVTVISQPFWQRRLGADPDVIGRTLTLNTTAYTIIGVLPEGYRRGHAPEVIVPLSTALYPRLFERDSATLGYTGRLARDRTILQTQQALAAVLSRLERQFPDKVKLEPGRQLRLRPLAGLARFGKESWELKFSGLLAVVALVVLLIACANAAGLLLARGVARRREIAIRLAIGATRRRVVRQLLVETGLIAAGGTAAGIGFALAAARILERVSLRGESMYFEFTPDWRFAAAAVALGVIATFLSGVAPALSSSRAGLFDALHASRSATPRLRLRSLLVSAQVASTVVLLLGGFVLVRNLIHVLRFDPGFDTARTLELDLTTTDPKIYPVPLREKVLRAVEAHPGVEAVSWAWYMPFNLAYGEYQLRRADAPDRPVFKVTAQGIGPGYLRTMRIPLLAGRELEWGDVRLAAGSPVKPALANRAFARRYFPDRNPVGAHLIGGLTGNDRDVIEIVGVSADTSFVRSPGEEPAPLLQPLSNLRHSFVVRVAGSPAAAAPELARLIERLVPGAAVGYFSGLERLDQGIRATRLATVLLNGLAVLGLLLALIGLCALSIYNVGRRTQEIGIRMALGAAPADVMRLMVGEGLTLVAIGVAAGLACAAALAGALRGFLAADIQPLDPQACAATLATLLVTGWASVYVPSRRATRIDPMIALRGE